MAQEIYLVRHGRREQRWQKLCQEGFQDAKQAAQELSDRMIGEATIIATTSRPASQTATIIAERLGSLMFNSPRLGGAENTPAAVDSLDEWLKKALDEAGERADGSLVAVTGPRIIAIALYGKWIPELERKIEPGSVWEYIPGSWHNQDYDDRAREYVEPYLLSLASIGSIAPINSAQ